MLGCCAQGGRTALADPAQASDRPHVEVVPLGDLALQVLDGEVLQEDARVQRLVRGLDQDAQDCGEMFASTAGEHTRHAKHNLPCTLTGPLLATQVAGHARRLELQVREIDVVERAGLCCIRSQPHRPKGQTLARLRFYLRMRRTRLRDESVCVDEAGEGGPVDSSPPILEPSASGMNRVK